MKKLIRVTQVVPMKGFLCRVTFEDGTQKIIDVEPFLQGPIFQEIHNNKELFRSIRVIEGTIGWENGADIDPDVLYYDLKPAWMEEMNARKV